MDMRALNTRNHTKGRITREQFLDYESVRSLGKINMFGYDTDIQRDENYKTCYTWFVEKKQTSDLDINIHSGRATTHLIERENGIIWDPMTGFDVDLD